MATAVMVVCTQYQSAETKRHTSAAVPFYSTVAVGLKFTKPSFYLTTMIVPYPRFIPRHSRDDRDREVVGPAFLCRLLSSSLDAISSFMALLAIALLVMVQCTLCH